jgi:hypothetical protein
MAAQDFVQGLFQDGDLEGTPQVNHLSHIIGQVAGIKLIQEPEALLGK